MTLSAAMRSAQATFNNVGTQTGVTSRNISNAENPNYVRRSTVLATGGNGAQIAAIERAQNLSLLRQTIESSSLYSGQQTLLAGLEEIKSLMGGNDYETSPHTLISNLRISLQTWAAKPDEVTLGATLVASAQDLVNGLNNAAANLQDIRKRADAEIKDSVDKLNRLLSQFELANNNVKQETATGGNPNDALDQRETLLKQISELVGVTTVRREHGDLALYTSDGMVLFETVARDVSFAPTWGFEAATVGAKVFVDGVVLKPGLGPDTSAKGSLQALLQLRDEIAPRFQSQLDEIARGLIVTFAETENAVPASVAPGLFTWTPTPPATPTSLPSAGTDTIGLSSLVKVNPAVVPPGGTVNQIRDGVNWTFNISGAASFSDHLNRLDDAFETKIMFDASTEIGGALSLHAFAANSIGWLELNRSIATTAGENKLAMLSRATEAYSSETGVSLDEELSLLLDIEQSYKAAAKLMSTVDTMMQALLEAAS